MDKVEYKMYYFDMEFINKTFIIHYANNEYPHPDWTWDSSTQPSEDLVLWLIKEGQADVHIDDGTKITIKRGSCLFFDLSKRHYAVQNPKKMLNSVAIRFKCTTTKKPFLSFAQHSSLPYFSFMEQLMSNCIEAHWENENEIANHWLKSALLNYNKVSKIFAGKKIDLNIHEVISTLCQRINQNPEFQWSVSKLAQQLNFSSDHFIRLFKAQTNQTPNEYIVNNRIMAAQSLLLRTNLSIQEIANTLNYSDPYYFSKQFKKISGSSPRKYREQHTNE